MMGGGWRGFPQIGTELPDLSLVVGAAFVRPIGLARPLATSSSAMPALTSPARSAPSRDSMPTVRCPPPVALWVLVPLTFSFSKPDGVKKGPSPIQGYVHEIWYIKSLSKFDVEAESCFGCRPASVPRVCSPRKVIRRPSENVESRLSSSRDHVAARRKWGTTFAPFPNSL